MASSRGRVTSIAINSHKVSFALDRKNNERFELYNEAPNTQTVPQFEVATRSWMLSILQTAFTSKNELIVTHDSDRKVGQIELHDPLHIANPPIVDKGPAIPGNPGAPAKPIKPAGKRS